MLYSSFTSHNFINNSVFRGSYEIKANLTVLYFFLIIGFLLSAVLVGKISYHFTSRSAASQNSEENSQPSSASLSAQSENWGLGFQEEGTRPSGNASIEELKQYNAWYAQDTDEKIIYLTFDAGYENGNMPAILDALHKHQVHATFFVVGTLIREKPELIREISDAGHTVGNHTMTHPDMSGISTKEAFQKQLEDVEALYKDATGNEMTKFYRPPQGIYSTDNLQMAKDLGYSTFFGVWLMLTGIRINSLKRRSLPETSGTDPPGCYCTAAQHFFHQCRDPG